MALADGQEWLDQGANFLLFDPPGVGKSHMVCGLGHALALSVNGEVPV